jgi:hypothetical protein
MRAIVTALTVTYFKTLEIVLEEGFSGDGSINGHIITKVILNMKPAFCI